MLVIVECKYRILNSLINFNNTKHLMLYWPEKIAQWKNWKAIGETFSQQWVNVCEKELTLQWLTSLT